MPSRRSTPGPARRVIIVIAIAIVAAGAGAVAVTLAWQPLRYGRAEPPAPRLDGVEPPLARRIDTLTRAVRAAPYSAEAWGRLGIVYEVHDMQREAVACYERAARLDPDAFVWPYFLGLCTLPSDHQTSMRHLLEARRLRDDYAPLELHLGRAYFDVGDLDEADAHYRRAAALDAGLVRPLIGRGRVAIARGDAAAAVEHLKRALVLRPHSAEVHFQLAEAYRTLGDAEAASHHLELAGNRAEYEQVPDEVRTAWQWEAGVTAYWRKIRAEQDLRDGRPDLAAAEWAQLLEDEPDSARAYVELGRIYQIARRPDDAIRAYESALARDEDLPSARYNLGRLLFGRGEIDRGLVLLREACAALPSNPDVRGTLARALDTVDRRDEALRVRLVQAELLVAAERWEDAIAVLAPPADTERAGSKTYALLARALAGAGHTADAVTMLERGLRVHPGDAALLALLAEHREE